MRYTWTDIERLTEALRTLIEADGFRPDYLVGVAAGGLIPLYYLSKCLRVENIVTITARSYTGHVRGAVELLHVPNINARGKCVLLVDEIAHSGESLKVITECIRERWRPGALKSAVFCMNDADCLYRPDYVASRTREWVDFPWECYERQSNSGDALKEGT